MKKFKVLSLFILMLVIPSMCFAGILDRFSDITLTRDNVIEIPNITAPSTNPKTGENWIYVVSGVPYFEDASGNVTNLGPAVTGDFDVTGTLTAVGTVDITGPTALTGSLTATGTVDITGPVTASGMIVGTSGVSAGGAADSYIMTDTIELSNADIKALRATPKTLVAAAGANTIVEFLSAVLILDYGSEVLTESDDNLVIEYEDGQDITAAIESTGFIDAAADQMAFVNSAGIASMTAATASNKAIQLFNTGDGEFGGNASADTTMTVKVNYRVHADGL